MATAAKPKTLAGALLAFQGEVSKVGKDSVNSHFSNSYASLEKIMEVIRPVLQKHGLVLSQILDNAHGHAALRTIIMHPESDQALEGVCPFPTGLNAQQMGSAVTYFRRYGALAVLGLVTDADDDGNLASTATPVVAQASTSPTDVPVPAGTTPLPAAPAAGIGGAVGGVL
jgi:hypothetical protein